MSVLVYRELFDAYDEVYARMGRPPVEIRVASAEEVAKGAPASDVAIVTLDTWRANVADVLRDMTGTRPSDELVDAYLRRGDWKFKDVPVKLAVT